MKDLKLGTFLIVLGNLLYLIYIFFSGYETSNFGDFGNGLLLGLSIGCNLAGIISVISYISKNNKEK